MEAVVKEEYKRDPRTFYVRGRGGGGHWCLQELYRARDTNSSEKTDRDVGVLEKKGLRRVCVPEQLGSIRCISGTGSAQQGLWQIGIGGVRRERICLGSERGLKSSKQHLQLRQPIRTVGSNDREETSIQGRRYSNPQQNLSEQSKVTRSLSFSFFLSFHFPSD